MTLYAQIHPTINTTAISNQELLTESYENSWSSITLFSKYNIKATPTIEKKEWYNCLTINNTKTYVIDRKLYLVDSG